MSVPSPGLSRVTRHLHLRWLLVTLSFKLGTSSFKLGNVTPASVPAHIDHAVAYQQRAEMPIDRPPPEIGAAHGEGSKRCGYGDLSVLHLADLAVASRVAALGSGGLLTPLSGSKT